VAISAIAGTLISFMDICPCFGSLQDHVDLQKASRKEVAFRDVALFSPITKGMRAKIVPSPEIPYEFVGQKMMEKKFRPCR
jgi:hypothetical protein